MSTSGSVSSRLSGLRCSRELLNASGRNLLVQLPLPGLVVLDRLAGERQLCFRSGREVLDIVAQVVRGRQCLAADGGLATAEDTDCQGVQGQPDHEL